MAASPSPNDLTRQQLDELDVLLQRMLALPISQPEPAVAFPPPPPLPDLPPLAPRAVPDSPTPSSWRADSPASSKAPHLTPAPEPATAFTPAVLPFPPRATPEPRPEPPAPRPSRFEPPEPTPTVAPGTLRGVDAPALPFDYRPAESFEAGANTPRTPSPYSSPPAVEFPEVNPFADSLPPVPAEPAAPSARPVPVFLWPLFAVNWVLEFLLGWFGPIGALLVRPAMKTLLGWAGVLLILGAGVWAARGLGWVSWPR